MDGAQIKAARERRGWTQQKLAAELGVGSRTIGNWERGETVPKSRAGMLDAVLGEPKESDPIRSASDVTLLAELMRRASARQAAAG
jgi:transcriptional regulator with XRE-family HTH domain